MRLLWLILSTFAMSTAAFAAPVELEAETEARLDAGHRQRVIVEFAVPAIDYARQNGASDREIAALINDARDSTLVRTFGRTASMLATLDGDENAPVPIRIFRYTPAAAMSLSSNEIEQLSRDPGVARILEDTLYFPDLYTVEALTGADELHALGGLLLVLRTPS